MTTPREDNRGLGRASMLLASGTVVSRVLGFISAIILARTLGTVGAGADTFALANQLPNNIYAIVAGGVLSAVLVPHIVKAGLDTDGGQRFVNKIVTLGFVIFVFAAVIATLLAPAFIALYSQSGADGGRGLTPEETALAIAFAYWCLPQILFYALYSLLSEVLNARKVFGPFTWAPALNNIVAMTGLVAFSFLFPGTDTTNALEWTSEMVVVLAGSATAGVASQALILLLFWKSAGLGFRPDFRWRGVGLGSAGKSASWVFGMVVVTQIAGVVQTNVASLAGGSDEASLAILRLSWGVFMLPHSIVAVSIATTFFTRMSASARDQQLGLVRRDVYEALSKITLLMFLATVGLIVVALPFATQFGGTEKAIRAMALVIGLYALGLVPFSALFVMQRVFYALNNTRTPFILQVLHASVFIVLALFSSTLPISQIAYGVAISASVAGTVQSIAATLALRRALGGLNLKELVKKSTKFLAAAGFASMAGVSVLRGIGGPDGQLYIENGALWSGLVIVVITIVMTTVFISALLVFRSQDMRDLLAPLLRRLPFTRSGNSSS